MKDLGQGGRSSPPKKRSTRKVARNSIGIPAAPVIREEEEDDDDDGHHHDHHHDAGAAAGDVGFPGAAPAVGRKRSCTQFVGKGSSARIGGVKKEGEHHGDDVEEEDLDYLQKINEMAESLRINRGDFEARVFQVVASIPKGKVSSYGRVAALAGAPKNSRQVGKLLADGLACGVAPWQRVINSAGAISLPPAYGGNTQRALLKAEGVQFGPSGKVVSSSFWVPTDEEKTCLFTY